jgi:hypothetical protein
MRSRFLFPLLGLMAMWAFIQRRRPVPARQPRTHINNSLVSVAGEEDPGAAVDSPAPPRPVGRA